MKTGFIGYTYQQQISLLLLCQMDVNRDIETLEMECEDGHKFDDVNIFGPNGNLFVQTKDFNRAELSDIRVEADAVYIKNVKHNKGPGANAIIFREIQIEANTDLMGFPAQLYRGVYILSMNRWEVSEHIENLYRSNFARKFRIEQFFSAYLDRRNFVIRKVDLPPIDLFHTELFEKTVDVERAVIPFESVLFIEGKPGIGKSHLVSYIQKKFTNNTLYRFWISEQDRDRKTRLEYIHFLNNLSKELFLDQKLRTEQEIISRFKSSSKQLILDGLDHVENYNVEDLDKYFNFIAILSEHCKIIVLSRPLRKVHSYKVQILSNWNFVQTEKVLLEGFQVSDYHRIQDIYRMSNGYPLLVRYLSAHLTAHGSLPELSVVDGLDSYYSKVLGQNGLYGMAIFLCCDSYIARSEVAMFLDSFSSSFVNEFIDQHPYLFEIRLNRIALFHDSFRTYLKNQNIEYTSLSEKINTLVARSLLSQESRYMSRFGDFNLMPENQAKIVSKYASIEIFDQITLSAIDYEAVQEYYIHVRSAMCLVDPESLSYQQYFELMLIFQITTRNQIRDNIPLLFHYSEALFKNGFTTQDITSNGSLFAFSYYRQTGDGTLLFNIFSDKHYETRKFFEDLEGAIGEELEYFEYKPLGKSQIEKLLRSDSFQKQKYLEYVLCDLYLFEDNRETYPQLHQAVNYYLNGAEQKATDILVAYLGKGLAYENGWLLRDVKQRLLTLGKLVGENDYHKLTLSEHLEKYRFKSSFDLFTDLTDILRLHNSQDRSISFANIGNFHWKYQARHDYTLQWLPPLLQIFEKKGLTDFARSVELISSVQRVSEKGYRMLLLEYLTAHDVEMIGKVIGEFDLDELKVEWFRLPADHIDQFPDFLFNFSLNKIFRYHSSSKSIPLDELENVLSSKRRQELIKILRLLYFRIEVGQDDLERIKSFTADNIPFKIMEKDRYNQEKDDQKSFEEGILNHRNAYLIKEKGLLPRQVASMSDGNYWAPNLSEFISYFDKETLASDLKMAIHAIITTRRYDDFRYLVQGPEDLVRICYACDIELDYSIFYQLFKRYLDISSVSY